MQKRRRHPRFPLVGIAEVATAGREDRIMVTVYDISKGGIAIYSGVPFEKDVKLTMKLTFEDRDRQQVTQTLEGKVIRCMNWGPKKFIVGVELPMR